MNYLHNSHPLEKRISESNQLADKKKKLLQRRLKRPKLLLPKETEVKRYDQ